MFSLMGNFGDKSLVCAVFFTSFWLRFACSFHASENGFSLLRILLHVTDRLAFSNVTPFSFKVFILCRRDENVENEHSRAYHFPRLLNLEIQHTRWSWFFSMWHYSLSSEFITDDMSIWKCSPTGSFSNQFCYPIFSWNFKRKSGGCSYIASPIFRNRKKNYS